MGSMSCGLSDTSVFFLQYHGILALHKSIECAVQTSEHTGHWQMDTHWLWNQRKKKGEYECVTLADS